VTDDRVQKTRALAAAAADKLAERLNVLDVREVCAYADSFVLCSGSSDRHVRSIADGVREAAARLGEKVLGVEGYDEGRWVLIDVGDVVVHVFLNEVRDYYDLDRLWSDAPRLPVGEASDARTAS